MTLKKFKILNPLLCTLLIFITVPNFDFSPSILFFASHNLHISQKSNCLASPVISRNRFKYCVWKMISVFNHFLLPTSWYIKRISIRLKLEMRITKFKMWISKFKMQNLPTSFPCPVLQKATSFHPPAPWTLDLQCCNNEC